MITSDFTGNFGNHIWQYAVTRAVAELKGYDWGFTNHIYGDYYGGKHQMDFLDLDFGQPVKDIEYEYRETVEQIHHVDIVNIHKFDKFQNLKDNTKLVGCWQSEQYLDKEKVKQWIKIKNVDQYRDLTLNENTCVINVRGGEYKGISTVLLPKSYWNNAIRKMMDINSNMKFVVITDDVPYAQTLFSDFVCWHTGINTDYYIINSARYIILSNSSFAWFPAWLNERVECVIAPKYWARYNVSDGYWANSNILTKGWQYLNREGFLQDYESVVDELKKSKYNYLYNFQ